MIIQAGSCGIVIKSEDLGLDRQGADACDSRFLPVLPLLQVKRGQFHQFHGDSIRVKWYKLYLEQCLAYGRCSTKFR